LIRLLLVWAALPGVTLAGCSSCLDRKQAPPAVAAPEPEVREFPRKKASPPSPGAVRKAAVAGSWYYDDPAKLGPYLDELFASAPPGPKGDAPAGEVVALVSPHAGYSYSGKGAAAGFRLLKGRKIRRVVVLAVSHRVPLKGASIAQVSHYETPLGLIPLDAVAVERLRRLDLVGAVPEAHRQEHSLEMQLPLLQRALPDGFTLVPLLLGRLEQGDHKKLADALREILDEHTVVVASSDFTHRGPNYSYEVAPGEGTVQQRLASVDDVSVQRMLARDRAGLLKHARESGSTICGLQPVAVLLELLAGMKDVGSGVLSRYTSGDVSGDWRNTVTYISVAYTGRWPAGAVASKPPAARPGAGAPFPLTDKEKAVLLKLARDTLTASVKKGALDTGPLDALYLDDSLRRKAGAFVTLKCKLGRGAVCVGKGHGLRGCIGTIQPRTGVALTVAQRAASAALEDPRFPSKVSEAELGHISVEVSVLTPPRRINNAAEFEVGRHGVILQKGGRSATYLPQVAPEQGWDRDETLSHLSQKAGLGPDGWRDGASFQVYEAIVFGE